MRHAAEHKPRVVKGRASSRESDAARYAPIQVYNEAQEQEYVAKGYRSSEMSEVRQDYVEWPKWVCGEVAADAAEEAKILTRHGETGRVIEDKAVVQAIELLRSRGYRVAKAKL